MSWFTDAISAILVCLATIVIGRLFWTKFKIKHNIQADSPIGNWKVHVGPVNNTIQVKQLGKIYEVKNDD